MAFAALAPLLVPALETAGATVGPYLAELIGEKGLKTLTPLAKQAVLKLIHSKAVGRKVHNLANNFFSKNKTARKLFSKGKKLASHAFSEEGAALLGKGLKLGGDLGLLSGEKQKYINDKYHKAMAFHDQLSAINMPKSKVA
jgi:hypothetical protein